MGFDPSGSEYSRLARTGTAQGPGSLIEKAMLISLNKAFTGTTKFFKIMGTSKTVKAVKESTKLFTAIGKVGQYAKQLTETFTLTQTLIGMPGRTATAGLDMLTSQIVAPISGAITQAIGSLSASLNQILGPALQSIGQAVGGFVRQQPIGAGIGGMIGGVVGAITGIPGLGLVGGLVGAGVEALVGAVAGGIAAPFTEPSPTEDRDEIVRWIQAMYAQGRSLEQIAIDIQSGVGGRAERARNLGYDNIRALRELLGIPIPGGGAEELELISEAGVVIPPRVQMMENIEGGGSSSLGGGAVLGELQTLNRTTRMAWLE